MGAGYTLKNLFCVLSDEDRMEVRLVSIRVYGSFIRGRHYV